MNCLVANKQVFNDLRLIIRCSVFAYVVTYDADN